MAVNFVVYGRGTRPIQDRRDCSVEKLSQWSNVLHDPLPDFMTKNRFLKYGRAFAKMEGNDMKYGV